MHGMYRFRSRGERVGTRLGFAQRSHHVYTQSAFEQDVIFETLGPAFKASENRNSTAKAQAVPNHFATMDCIASLSENDPPHIPSKATSTHRHQSKLP